jgi:hypothetical protein
VNKYTCKYSMITLVLIRVVPYSREFDSAFSLQSIRSSFRDFMLHSWRTEWQRSRILSECLQSSPANHLRNISLYAVMITLTRQHITISEAVS